MAGESENAELLELLDLLDGDGFLVKACRFEAEKKETAYALFEAFLEDFLRGLVQWKIHKRTEFPEIGQFLASRDYALRMVSPYGEIVICWNTEGLGFEISSIDVWEKQ